MREERGRERGGERSEEVSRKKRSVMIIIQMN
jgi:hypothetical protein